MKKLMIALAVAAMAVASQAASFKWTTTDVVGGVVLDSLNGNGDYAASGSTLTKQAATLSFTLSIYEAGTKTLVGSASKAIAYAFTNPKGFSTTIAITGDIKTSTAYDYVIEVTGTQADMLTYESDTWDYSKSTISWTTEGSLTTAASATTGFSTSSPTTWTVAGATQKEEPTPEPTSAMLMLLGMAGLALKRKQK